MKMCEKDCSKCEVYKIIKNLGEPKLLPPKVERPRFTRSDFIKANMKGVR